MQPRKYYTSLTYHFDLTDNGSGKILVTTYIREEGRDQMVQFDPVYMTEENFESFKETIRGYLPMHEHLEEVVEWIDCGLNFMSQEV